MKHKYILGSINICILILSIILLLIGIINIKLLSQTQLILLIISSIITVLISIRTYLSKKVNIYNIGVMLTIILNLIVIYNINALNNDYSYINNVISEKYQYNDYYILVKKNTKYSSLDKINNKKVGILRNNRINVESTINNKVKINYIEYGNNQELLNSIDNNEVQAIIISKRTYQKLNNEEKLGKYHKIYTSKVKESL